MTQAGQETLVISQTALEHRTATAEERACLPLSKMAFPNVIVLKDGWALHVNYLVNMDLQQMTIYVYVNHATMALHVICYVQTIVRSA